MNIDEFSFLWTSEKDVYVLVNTEFGYGIVNKAKKTVQIPPKRRKPSANSGVTIPV